MKIRQLIVLIVIFGVVFVGNCTCSRKFMPPTSPLRTSLGFQESDSIRYSRAVKTLYGTFYLSEELWDDRLILNLLDCKAMQRLKNIHQYGVRFFVADDARPYSRYEHSVGVWALLRRYGACLKEQIAGLLHDVSHTVFSHVGDFVFRNEEKKSAYQDDIHEWFISKTNIPKILKRFGIDVKDILLDDNRFAMVKQAYPDLSIDPVEYNLKGGLIKGYITREDVEIILQDLNFENGKWYFHTPKIARKFVMVALNLMRYEWGGPERCLIYPLAAHAVRRAMEINLITEKEFHFSNDKIIWNRLNRSRDSIIKDAIKLMRDYEHLQVVTSADKCDYKHKVKFRGIDPWIKDDLGNFSRLSNVDWYYSQKYKQDKKQVENGWPVTFNPILRDFLGDPASVLLARV